MYIECSVNHWFQYTAFYTVCQLEGCPCFDKSRGWKTVHFDSISQISSRQRPRHIRQKAFPHLRMAHPTGTTPGTLSPSAFATGHIFSPPRTFSHFILCAPSKSKNAPNTAQASGAHSAFRTKKSCEGQSIATAEAVPRRQPPGFRLFLQPIDRAVQGRQTVPRLQA